MWFPVIIIKIKQRRENSTIKPWYWCDPWITICLIPFEEKGTVDTNTFMLDLRTNSSTANWIPSNYGPIFLWAFGWWCKWSHEFISQFTYMVNYFSRALLYFATGWNAETCNSLLGYSTLRCFRAKQKVLNVHMTFWSSFSSMKQFEFWISIKIVLRGFNCQVMPHVQ